MSGWKGGGVLLVLAIPLALYAAWQVKGVVRADMVVSDPPPDRGGSKDQLTANKDKMTRWASEARKATTVALQYRQPGSSDQPLDSSAAEVVKTSAARAAELNDLDQFLTGVENPKYMGKMTENYTRWKQDLDKARNAEKDIAAFLVRPTAVTSGIEAANFMSDLDKRLEEYQNRNFSNWGKAAEWRIRGRVAVIRELGTLADSQYPKAAGVSLPLKSDTDALKTAQTTLAAVKTQSALLEKDVQRAEEEKADIPAALRGEIDDRQATAAKCAKREALLGLFTRDDLFRNSSGAPAWLREVATLYRDTKDEADRRMIRKKVQEFCEVFIPAAVRLDDEVLIVGKSVKRAAVSVKYLESGVRKYEPLTGDPNGLNEFNVAATYPGETTSLLAPTEEYLKDLKPTTLSKAALQYTEARKTVGLGISGPKWTVKTLEDLKKKCDEHKELVDNLNKLKALREKDKFPDKKDTRSPEKDDELNIRVRIEGVLEGLKECGAWVETP